MQVHLSGRLVKLARLNLTGVPANMNMDRPYDSHK